MISPAEAVEIVTLRLTMIGLVKKPKVTTMLVPPRGNANPIARRAVYFDATTGWLDTPIYNRAKLPIGDDMSGPAVIEEMSATTLLHPGQHATTDKAGNLIITTQPRHL